MIKSKVSLLVWKHKVNSQGLHPIVLRITVAGKRSYITTGRHINLKYWDDKTELVKTSHIDAAIINQDLLLKKREAEEKVFNLQVEKKEFTAKTIKQAAVSYRGGSNVLKFVAEYHKEIAGRQSNRTVINNNNHINHIIEFHGSDDLTFEEIDHKFLASYESYLRGKKYSPAYTRLLLRTVRTMFNAARKRKIISCYPFDTFSLPEEYSKPKEYLSLAEVKKIESNLKKLKGTQYAASLYFLLGCYTGLRVSDWRVFSASERIRDGWVRVVPLKNKGWVSMPMPPGLARIVPALMDTKCLNSEQQINDLLRDLLPEIGITRHITTHCARHTFAVTMCAERGISCEVCAELMGITVQTCAETYYKVTNVKIEKEVVKAWKGL